jgi:hypothetical protein
VDADGEFGEQPHAWEMLAPEVPELNSLPDTEIISIINEVGHFSNASAEERARQSLAWMRENDAWRRAGARGLTPCGTPLARARKRRPLVVS